MKKKERIILEKVTIESVVAEGKCIAKIDGKVLFVPYAVPGDVADVLVTKKKRGYMEGVIEKLHSPSPDRISPVCEHFGICGGCKWQQLPYKMQLEAKQQQVLDQLSRIGHLSLPEITPILGSKKTEFYRNKLEYSFSSKRWIEQDEPKEIQDKDLYALGFHVSGFFDKVLDIKKCYLQPDPSNDIRLFIKKFALDNDYSFFDLREQTGFLRAIFIRTASTGEVMLIVVFAYEDTEKRTLLLDAVKERFPHITSLIYIINDKRNENISDLPSHCYYGNDAIYEKMENLNFRIGPISFYQTNSEQAYRLYSLIREYADLQGDEIVYDLYTGTGTIALFLAKQASKIVGIEYVPEAIQDAKQNAIANNISNCLFYAGDMKAILNKDFIQQNGSPDVIILDPPRAGIHPSVVEVILETQTPKIVYVSCNPASQARDIALMSGLYQITKVHPVDMFPHTHHLENIVVMELK